MFFPPKNVIAICAAAACVLGSVSANAQTNSNNTAEYNRRMAAMERARQRTQQPVARMSQAIVQPEIETPTNQIVVNRQTSRVRPATAHVARTASVPARSRGQRGFVPRHLRTAQVLDGQIIHGGAPIVGDSIAGDSIIGDSIAGGGTIIYDAPMGGTVIGSEIIGDPIIDGGCANGNCGGGCSSCGDIGDSFFDDDCCGRGGCSSDMPCWMGRFGKVFRRGQYFGGFTSFRSGLYTRPQSVDPSLVGNGLNDFVDDSSHGTYGGFNLGLPLCRLSCGLFSGQFGVRSVNTNFGGAEFTPDDRNQLFMTAGFFRRVDYGLQLGIAADVLREEWYSNVDLVQIRGDVGYVWPSGTTFGFRFANNIQDDPAIGIFDGIESQQTVTTSDWYRFYLRHDIKTGGFGECFAGWTENDQAIAGLNMDFPVTDRISVESGFTYFIGDQELSPAGSNGFRGGDSADAYNMYVGFSVRPSGARTFRSYDRPLFDVADNGTMMMVR